MSKLLRIGSVTLVLLVILAMSLISNVAAAGYNKNSQVTCPSNVDAASWLNWWDQPPSSSGHTVGDLYWWNTASQSWVSMAGGSNDDYGSTGNAQVDLHHQYVAGQWWEHGSHTASFFSGTQTSNSTVYCP